MITICLTNDTLSDADFKTVVDAVNYFVPMVVKAWKLSPVTITTTPSPNAWMVNISDKNRHAGAGAYHTVTAGIPTAWCSPAAVNNKVGGYYAAGRFGLVKNALGRFVKSTTPTSPARYSSGVVTDVCHEIAEMLSDSNIATYSAPDPQGRQWLVEICDHVFGTYLVHSIEQTVCVFPNITTPAFYDAKGKAPYDLLGVVSSPFTMTPKGYGYWSSPKGLVKI
jgi:hypothetical protein